MKDDELDFGNELPEDKGTSTPAAEPAKPADVAEVEGEETEAERLEREAEETKKRQRIPVTRHEAILAKQRAETAKAQRENEELRQQLAGKQQTAAVNALTARQAEIDAKQTKYEELLLDGKKDEAKALRAEFTAEQRKLDKEQMDAAVSVASSRAVEAMQYDAMVVEIEKAYPVLNPDHADYDQDKAVETAELANALLARGLTRIQATQKAVQYVCGAPAKAAEPVKPVKAAEPEPPKVSARAAAAAAAIMKGQPPVPTVAAGSGDPGITVLPRNSDEWNKLSKADQDKLLGIEP